MTLVSLTIDSYHLRSQLASRARPSSREIPRESELIRRRRRATESLQNSKLEGFERRGPEGYLRAIREVPEAFMKSHQTLRRKLSDRGVNHSHGEL